MIKESYVSQLLRKRQTPTIIKKPNILQNSRISLCKLRYKNSPKLLQRCLYKAR